MERILAECCAVKPRMVQASLLTSLSNHFEQSSGSCPLPCQESGWLHHRIPRIDSNGIQIQNLNESRDKDAARMKRNGHLVQWLTQMVAFHACVIPPPSGPRPRMPAGKEETTIKKKVDNDATINKRLRKWERSWMRRCEKGKGKKE